MAIARAVAKSPTLLLCDEPTGSLDFQTGKRVLRLLVDLNQRWKTTVVIITHNGAIAEVADRVIHLRSGEITEVMENAVADCPGGGGLVNMLDRKLARELYRSKGLLLAITSIVAVGMTCFVSMRSAYHNLQQAKIDYYRQCRMADFWIDLKKAPLAEIATLEEIPGITQITPRIQFAATVDLEHVAKADQLAGALSAGQATRGDQRYCAAGRGLLHRSPAERSDCQRLVCPASQSLSGQLDPSAVEQPPPGTVCCRDGDQQRVHLPARPRGFGARPQQFWCLLSEAVVCRGSL